MDPVENQPPFPIDSARRANDNKDEFSLRVGNKNNELETTNKKDLPEASKRTELDAVLKATTRNRNLAIGAAVLGVSLFIVGLALIPMTFGISSLIWAAGLALIIGGIMKAFEFQAKMGDLQEEIKNEEKSAESADQDASNNAIDLQVNQLNPNANAAEH